MDKKTEKNKRNSLIIPKKASTNAQKKGTARRVSSRKSVPTASVVPKSPPPRMRSVSLENATKKVLLKSCTVDLSKDSIFDRDGYSNSNLLSFFRNQIADRIFISEKLREKMSGKIKEIDNQVTEFDKWTKLIDEWDYVQLDNTISDSDTYVEKSEAQLEEIKELLNETDKFHFAIEQAIEEIESDRNFLRNLDIFVASSGKRWGRITRSPNGYFVSCLSITEKPVDAKFLSLQNFSNIAECKPVSTLFLDLRWNGHVQTRIYLEAVDLETNTCFPKLKNKLFLGEPMLKGLPLSAIIYQEADYQASNDENLKKEISTDAEGNPYERIYLLESLSWESVFLIIHGNIEGLNRKELLEVTQGGFILRHILQCDFYQSVIIDDCGLVMCRNM